MGRDVKYGTCRYLLQKLESHKVRYLLMAREQKNYKQYFPDKRIFFSLILHTKIHLLYALKNNQQKSLT